MTAQTYRRIPARESERGLVVQAWLALGVLVVALLATAPARAAGEHTTPRPPDGDAPPMARFYAGSSVKVGDFPGKLVCLRCDLKPGQEAMAECEREGHRHALAMETDSMVHPPLAGSEDVLQQINSGALHGTHVTVHGKYCSATGAILVDRISAEK